MNYLLEHGFIQYGPYNELEFTRRAWPFCVAVGVACVLLVALIEHNTLIV